MHFRALSSGSRLDRCQSVARAIWSTVVVVLCFTAMRVLASEPVKPEPHTAPAGNTPVVVAHLSSTQGDVYGTLVTIRQLHLGAQADSNGFVKFDRVAPGTYVVEITRVEGGRKDTTITIPDAQRVLLELSADVPYKSLGDPAPAGVNELKIILRSNDSQETLRNVPIRIVDSLGSEILARANSFGFASIIYVRYGPARVFTSLTNEWLSSRASIVVGSHRPLPDTLMVTLRRRTSHAPMGKHTRSVAR